MNPIRETIPPPAPAQDTVRRTLRMRPVLLYCALLLLAAGTAWSMRKHLDEQREHLLERQNNAMTWAAFIAESPMTGVIDALLFDTQRNLARTLLPEDFSATPSATESSPGMTRRDRARAALDGLSKTHASWVRSVSVLNLDGQTVVGPPVDITPEVTEAIAATRRAGERRSFLRWKLTPSANREASEVCLWAPLTSGNSGNMTGVMVCTLATRGFGNLEKRPSELRGSTRMLPPLTRQAAVRGLTKIDRDMRVILLDDAFRVILTLSGDRFADDIPDPGTTFVSPASRAARDTGLRIGMPRVSYREPESGRIPACHCLIDVSTHGLGYTIVVQSVESSVLAPWMTATRSAAYVGALLLGASALILLLDLRRRRNRAELASLQTELLLRRTREEEMEKARTGLELRVEERTAELAEANRELAAYAHTVSHDLRAPLRAVKNRVEMLLEDRPDLASGETAERLRESWPAQRVRLVLPENCPADADPALIRIALENLLGNAWKYTAKTAEPQVEFSVRDTADGGREYVVADNGAGFPDELASQLFKPFVRLHTSREFEGTGLGLATVARIIRLHGGEIRGTGTPGAGARFTFTLGPVAPES